jgi:hypothetical protein
MRNRKINIALYSLVIVLTICIVSVTGYNIYGRGTHTSSYSLLPKYSDIQSMYNESDIIVIGEIKKNSEPIIVDRRDYYDLGPNDKKEDFIPVYSKYIVSEVKIDKVLKGAIEKDKSIEVLQETLYDNSSDAELKKVKVYKNKEKYVLFLKYYNLESEQAKKDFKTPKYLPLGMYQGQLEIVDNNVKVDKEKLNIFDNDMTVEEIEKIISDCEIK